MKQLNQTSFTVLLAPKKWLTTITMVFLAFMANTQLAMAKTSPNLVITGADVKNMRAAIQSEGQFKSTFLTSKASVDEHRAIYEALKSRDAKAARTLMREHLMRVIDGILQATEVEAVEAARKQVIKSRERLSKTRGLI